MRKVLLYLGAKRIICGSYLQHKLFFIVDAKNDVEKALLVRTVANYALVQTAVFVIP